MAVRKRANSWQYDFKLQGYGRQRRAGFVRLGGLRHRAQSPSGHPTPVDHRPGGPARHQRPAGHAGHAQEQRGVFARRDRGHPRRDPLAYPAGIRRPGVPVQQGRDLSSLHRQLQTPDGRRPAGARASTAQPPCARPPLCGKPSGDQRALHQGSASTARSSIRAEHAHVRAPRVACPTPFGGGFAACITTARHPDGTEQKERHLAFLLSARLRWLRGPDLNRRPSGYEPDELPCCSTPRPLYSHGL